MSQKFFITGYPRSRTAWLANLLSYGDQSFCFHEGMRRAKDNAGLFALYDGMPHALVGDSSCGLLLNWREVASRYPDAKWVAIVRDPQAVLASCRRAFPWLRVSAPVVRDLRDKLDEFLKSGVQMMSVGYDQLDDEVSNILKFLKLEIHPQRVAQCLENKTEIFASKALASPAAANSPLRFQVESLLTAADAPRSASPTLAPEAHWPPAAHRLSEQYRGLLKEMCGERVDAGWFLNELLNVWLVWDHFRDNDPQNPDDVENAFCAMLLNWPNNAFVCQWGKYLAPTISAAITANKTDGKGIKGWDVYSEIPMAVATILGGHALAEKYSKPIRDLVAQMKAEDDREDEV